MKRFKIIEVIFFTLFVIYILSTIALQVHHAFLIRDLTSMHYKQQREIKVLQEDNK